MIVAILIYYGIIIAFFTLLGILLWRLRLNHYFIWSFVLLGLFYLSMTGWEIILWEMGGLSNPLYAVYVWGFMTTTVLLGFVVIYGVILRRAGTFTWRKMGYIAILIVGMALAFGALEDFGHWVILWIDGQYTFGYMMSWFILKPLLVVMLVIGIPLLVIAFWVSKPQNPRNLIILA
jgi:hypothetical protein